MPSGICLTYRALIGRLVDERQAAFGTKRGSRPSILHPPRIASSGVRFWRCSGAGPVWDRMVYSIRIWPPMMLFVMKLQANRSLAQVVIVRGLETKVDKESAGRK